MAGTFIEKRRVLGDVDAISTTEVCRLLGITISAQRIEELKEVSPVFVSATGTFWRREQVPLIAMALSANLIRIAGDLLHQINITGEVDG